MKARAIENSRHNGPAEDNRKMRVHLLYVFALPLALLTLGGCFSSICEDLAALEANPPAPAKTGRKRNRDRQ